MSSAEAEAAATEPPLVNPERGEHELKLGRKTYRLRPSHQAILAIEKKTGRSTLALMRAGNSGDLPITDLGIIAAELIRAGAGDGDMGARHIDDERASELIFEEGMPSVTARLTLCLWDAATGGRDVSGEAKAAPADPTKDAGAA